jgi:F-type H+-transporting ATPase subunit c
MNLKRLGAAAVAFLSTMLLFAATAFAADGAPDNESTVKGMIALSVGFGLAIAAAGGAFGQGRAAAAALEGIGRNPAAAKEMFTPMLLALALIESLVIYSLVISFMLVGKL